MTSVLILLLFMGATIPVIGAPWWAAKVGGVKGALLGLTVGLIIGLGNYYGIKTAGKRCLRWVTRCKEQQHSMKWPNRLLRFLMLTLFFWIIISELLGFYITQLVVKLWLK